MDNFMLSETIPRQIIEPHQERTGASFIKKVPRTNLKSVPGHFLRHV